MGVWVGSIVIVEFGVLVGVLVNPIVAMDPVGVTAVTVGCTGGVKGVEFMDVCNADWVNAANVAATLVATKPESVVGFACRRLHAVKTLTSKRIVPSRGWVSFMRINTPISTRRILILFPLE
jgi:hypothetical protein